MTQEDKSLLIRDLCTRLPYGTMIQVSDWAVVDTELKFGHIERLKYEDLKLKPYLRPMSSMTEEEKVEYEELEKQCESLPTFAYISVSKCILFDWLNKYHFDYRGLIEKNLAIKVSKENNPYKE